MTRFMTTFGSTACALTMLAGAAHAQSLPGGSAAHGGNTTTGIDWTYDTGADQTTLSRDHADDLDLLDDNDGDGVPDEADGQRIFNGGAVQMWCFENVLVVVIDSCGNVCLDWTTVYVSKNNDFWGGQNLLGKPLRKRFKGRWDDDTETVKWRMPLPWLTPWFEFLTSFVQDNNGQVRSVIEGGTFSGSDGNTVQVPMQYYNTADVSIIPQSVAIELGATIIDEVDLTKQYPGLYRSLEIGSHNPTLQKIFPVAKLNYDMGAGAGPVEITVLLSNDENSKVGVLGRDLITATVQALPEQPGEDFDIIYFEQENDDEPDIFGLGQRFPDEITPEPCEGDLDGDGDIDIADLNRFILRFNQPC